MVNRPADSGSALAAEDVTIADELPERLEGRRLRSFLRNRAALISLVVLVAVVVSALAAPWLTGLDPNKNELRLVFADPLTQCGDDLCSQAGRRWLGTDDIGRDILSRLLHGSRVSLLVGLGSVLASLVVALPVGMLAGYVGGKLDWLMMRLVDIVLSIPPLILVFAVAGVLGASLRNAIIALGVYFTPLFIRLIRSEVLRMRTSQLVESERAVGVPNWYILGRHVLPNISSSLIVQVSLAIGTAIIAEASLSFLGLGVQAPQSSWGIMLRSAFEFISREPWMILPPSLMIAATVLSLNLIGDGLRDALGRVR
ncbi:MAG: ABC transporter permease [Ilumatobacteraceae bacterium]|nr:ABC transporter permease [Ilumatobacteraceae bacterium]